MLGREIGPMFNFFKKKEKEFYDVVGAPLKGEAVPSAEVNDPTFAEERFLNCIENFTSVFDSLGSNVVSTEWLTTLESKDNFYPWMNYRIFSKKK